MLSPQGGAEITGIKSGGQRAVGREICKENGGGKVSFPVLLQTSCYKLLIYTSISIRPSPIKVINRGALRVDIIANLMLLAFPE